MDKTEASFQREVRKLRTEVRRLKRIVEVGVIAILIATALIFPQILAFAVCVAVLILFAFAVSPVRRMIFSSIFSKQDGRYGSALDRD